MSSVELDTPSSSISTPAYASSDNRSLWIDTSAIEAATRSQFLDPATVAGKDQNAVAGGVSSAQYFPSPARSNSASDAVSVHQSYGSYLDILGPSGIPDSSATPQSHTHMMKHMMDSAALLYQTMSPAVTPEEVSYLPYQPYESENICSFTELLSSDIPDSSSPGGGPMRHIRSPGFSGHGRSMSLDMSTLPFPSGSLASASSSVYTSGPLSSSSPGLGQFQNLTLFSPPANDGLLSPLVYSPDGFGHSPYGDSQDGLSFMQGNSDFLPPAPISGKKANESAVAAGTGGARTCRGLARRSYSLGSVGPLPNVASNASAPKALNRPVQPSPLSGVYTSGSEAPSTTTTPSFSFLPPMPEVHEGMYHHDLAGSPQSAQSFQSTTFPHIEMVGSEAADHHNQQHQGQFYRFHSSSEDSLANGVLSSPDEGSVKSSYNDSMPTVAPGGTVKTKPPAITPPAEIHITSSTKEDGSEYFPCPHCDREFARIQDIKRHLPVHYKPIREFECETCHTMFTRNDALRRHIRQGKCEGALRRQEKKRRLNMMMGMAMTF